VVYNTTSGQKIGEDVEESIWVLIDGEWYFDDYKSTNAR
jgi:hypothetical protein